MEISFNTMQLIEKLNYFAITKKGQRTNTKAMENRMLKEIEGSVLKDATVK